MVARDEMVEMSKLIHYTLPLFPFLMELEV